jgi:membrane protease YdiL (CAAX protease family)
MADPIASPTPAMGAPPPRDAFACELRGFGAVGLFAIVVIAAGNVLFIPLTGLLVLLWAWRSGTPWERIGYVRPRSWVGEALLGLVLGGVLKLVLKTLVMPLMFSDPLNHAYGYLRGNPSAIPPVLFAIVFGAGFSEETFFRGFLTERVRAWGRRDTEPSSIEHRGDEQRVKVAAVLIPAVLFGLAHLREQGMPGAVQALLFGLVFGLAYARLGRLWPLMWAQVGFDLVALWIIYAGLEEKVGHLIFR